MTDETDKLIKVRILANDSDYYNNVFKKTEKILSVILYILSETNITKKTQELSQLIKDKALLTHEQSLSTLQSETASASSAVKTLQHSLVSLDSTLRLAESSNLIASDIHLMLAEQLDGVMRYLNNHFLSKEGISLDDFLAPASGPTGTSATATKPKAKPTSRKQRVNIPSGDISTDAYLVYSQMTDRAERIKTVLEAKPQATVKDIAEVITDVSEKTIQRELNSLIEKGQVIREGERRWSRYSVAK
jgi:DNA-binding transcriptional ArsR family regulator